LHKDHINSFTDSVARLAVTYQRKNSVMLAGCIPLRWAYRKEKIPADVTLGLVMFSGKERKRKILTPDTVADIFRLDWPDCRAKAANMLAAVTGLRAGKYRHSASAIWAAAFCMSGIRGTGLTDTKQPKTTRSASWSFPSSL
jgi:hypothetical protein